MSFWPVRWWRLGEKLWCSTTLPSVCTRLGVPRLHLSLGELEACPQLREQVELLGVSVHTPAEAVRAQALGANYVTAGHVFDTDCKKGLPGRGLAFLVSVCAAVTIPVYAIGGIGMDNLSAVAQTGAAGACLMSGLMTCPNPAEMVCALRERLPCAFPHQPPLAWRPGR